MQYIILILIFILIAIYLYRNNNIINQTKIDFHSDKLPETFNNYKILHISDFHNITYKNDNMDLVTDLKTLNPNLIIFSGDAIDSRNLKFDVAYAFFKQLMSIAPVYYVSGNHEGRLSNYSEFMTNLDKLGVKVVNNSEMKLTLNEQHINIYGLQDPRFDGKDDDNANDEIKLKNQLESFSYNDDEFNLLISHRPEHFRLYCEYPFDLIFAGHAHGGQVRLPIIGGLFAPNQGLFPKYTSGIYKSGRSSMLVSRGLGPSRFPFRINNHPEVILVKLIKD